MATDLKKDASIFNQKLCFKKNSVSDFSEMERLNNQKDLPVIEVVVVEFFVTI